MGVITALAWLTSVGCRRNSSPTTPFSRASVIGQLASSYAGVSLPSDETPPNVLAYEELIYAHTSSGDLALDLYLPSLPEPLAGSAISAAPVAIVVHGGGWERGDRRMERPFAKQLAAAGSPPRRSAIGWARPAVFRMRCSTSRPRCAGCAPTRAAS